MKPILLHVYCNIHQGIQNRKFTMYVYLGKLFNEKLLSANLNGNDETR